MAELKIRWYGGGVYELASSDDKSIVLVDAWIWNNAGFERFKITKPPEFSSPSAYVAHIKARNPSTFLVALTHDHGDHMGDYFELLSALTAGGVDVKTVGQSDFFRVALPPKFKAANLDPEKLVLNGGSGMNFGGASSVGDIRLGLVPAVHSTFSCYPAAGFIVDIAGVRVYASGDTDLFGDMQLIGERYKPDLGVLCCGNGPFTMNPADAASACKLMALPHAIPVHYAHNDKVLGPACGEAFREAVARLSPRTVVTVFQPGQTMTVNVTVSGVASA
jgi:L-ascorbate metabolism protein UlaG (beta-lactamase superfamily)